MAHVTDLMLITGYSEETYPNNDRPIKKLNDYLRQNHEREFTRVDEHAGGDKGFCSAIYLCAINYLNLHNLLEVFRGCKWTFADTAMLLYKVEHDEQFTVCVPPEKERKKTMEEILEIIEKARNLPMDHEPDVSDLWDILNAIEKIAKNEVKK